MQEADVTAGNPVVPGKAVSVVRALAVLTVIFGALILCIPLDTFRFFGNLFEIAVAAGCMAACLYAYRNWSGRITLLLAAFAFGGYALSNTFWYLYSEAIGREYVFFTVSELGFLGFMLFFVVVFRTGFPVRPAPPLLRVALAGLILSPALLVTGALHLSLSTGLLLFWSLVVILLVDTALVHGIYRQSFLWTGISLWSFASILYGVRETLFIVQAGGVTTLPPGGFARSPYDFLSIVGPLFILSFLCIQLGLFADLTSRQD